MKSICVYCGSSLGTQTIYADLARQLAAAMVKDGIALVYGGGNIGLMGVIADEVMRLGGEVTGIIPLALMSKEVGHHGLSKLHVVKDMHERKALMAELSDGFIAMPGGIGTLEELFEAYTWLQLGLHDKPIGLLNVDGFYDGLLGFLAHTVRQGFLKPEQATLLITESEPQRLLERFKSFAGAKRVQELTQPMAQSLLP
ncbi:MAG: TIGR00730 family Rossman fold protein [Proteobacteria bacterium]|nr:TIGR00730 family Rossman fold protein [Pseudomonadota bacterium]